MQAFSRPGGWSTPSRPSRFVCCVLYSMVTLGGRGDDKPPGDTEGFLTFAQQLRTPTLYNAVSRRGEKGGMLDFERYRPGIDQPRHRHARRAARNGTPRRSNACSKGSSGMTLRWARVKDTADESGRPGGCRPSSGTPDYRTPKSR